MKPCRQHRHIFIARPQFIFLSGTSQHIVVRSAPCRHPPQTDPNVLHKMTSFLELLDNHKALSTVSFTACFILSIAAYAFSNLPWYTAGSIVLSAAWLRYCVLSGEANPKGCLTYVQLSWGSFLATFNFVFSVVNAILAHYSYGTVWYIALLMVLNFGLLWMFALKGTGKCPDCPEEAIVRSSCWPWQSMNCKAVGSRKLEHQRLRTSLKGATILGIETDAIAWL